MGVIGKGASGRWARKRRFSQP